MNVTEMRNKGVQNIAIVTEEFKLHTNLVDLTECYYLAKGRLRMLALLELISDDEYFELNELVTDCMKAKKTELERRV